MTARMHISFQLTMPSHPLWCKARLYVSILTMGNCKRNRARYEKLFGNHTYSFEDGWLANIEVREVSGEAKRQLMRKSSGFYGYEWMIRSLRLYGSIMTDAQQSEFLKNNPKRGKQ